MTRPLIATIYVMPTQSLSQDLKTAIEGREWVMHTTKNNILYTQTIQSLEEFYKHNNIDFTHNQAAGQVFDEPYMKEEGIMCTELLILGALTGMTWYFLLYVVNQMLPSPVLRGD